LNRRTQRKQSISSAIPHTFRVESCTKAFLSFPPVSKKNSADFEREKGGFKVNNPFRVCLFFVQKPWAAGLERPLPTATLNIPFGD
jgi:hypothetical protein